MLHPVLHPVFHPVFHSVLHIRKDKRTGETCADLDESKNIDVRSRVRGMGSWEVTEDSQFTMLFYIR